MHLDWKKIGNDLRKYVLNKYFIVLVGFAVIFLFVGEQSVVQQIRRARKIHFLQEQLRQSRRHIAEDEALLDKLQDTDSLEKYAREQYGMKKDGEDVYIVE